MPLWPIRPIRPIRPIWMKSLGGRLEYSSGSEYASFLLVFLLTEREGRANRAVARAAKPTGSLV
jgi:hypothetical protein